MLLDKVLYLPPTILEYPEEVAIMLFFPPTIVESQAKFKVLKEPPRIKDLLEPYIEFESPPIIPDFSERVNDG